MNPTDNNERPNTTFCNINPSLVTDNYETMDEAEMETVAADETTGRTTGDPLASFQEFSELLLTEKNRPVGDNYETIDEKEGDTCRDCGSR